MNMDRKLRRAFRNATPNVLGALPAREQKTKKSRRLPKKLMEALPAVASLALIIGAVALTAPYFGRFAGPGTLSTQPSAPPITTGTETQPPAGDEGLKETLRAAALAIVAQEGEQLESMVQKMKNDSSSDYLVTVQRQGFSYRLYYTKDAKLKQLMVYRDPEATGCIPEAVACCLAWLDWGQALESYTVEQKTTSQGLVYYEIKGILPGSGMEDTRYVHGETGEVNHNPPSSLGFVASISNDRAKELALDFWGYSPNGVEGLWASLNGYYYDVQFSIGDMEYTTTVSATDGSILRVDISGDQAMPVGSSALFGYKSEWRRRALTMEFTSAAQIDLARFFDCGFAEEEALTAAEQAALPEGVWHRLPMERMEEVLQATFGLGLAEMADAAFEGLRYLDSTGCWYAPEMGVEILKSQELDAYRCSVRQDGSLLIYYYNPQLGQMASILRRVEDYRTWQVLVNCKSEDVPADTVDLPDGMLTFDQASEKALDHLGMEKDDEQLFVLGNRAGDAYTVYVQDHDLILYTVEVDAHTGEALLKNLGSLVEGAVHYLLEDVAAQFADGYPFVSDWETSGDGVFRITWFAEEDGNKLPEERTHYLLTARFISGGTWEILSNEKVE